MTYQQLYENILAKKSFLCIGLDPEISKIPNRFKHMDHPIFEFNKEIIDATAEYAVAYKPNSAFYEVFGAQGWNELEMTVTYIRKRHPGLFVILDAKRCDIGNTARMYARAFFETLDFDAVTLSPYMGHDSVKPFLDHKGKWAIILAATSNDSAQDFELAGEEPLYAKVLNKAMQWGNLNNTMFVVGATRPEMFKSIRELCPDHFFLVPGVGAQGGTVSDVVKYGMNSHCGLLVNSSRGIIYAGEGDDFAKASAAAAKAMADEMAASLDARGLLKK